MNQYINSSNMANNYEYHTQLMEQQEEGACALNAQQQFESIAKIHCEEAIHQHQQLQEQQQQEHQLQQQQQQQHHHQQQMQQFENVVSSTPLTVSETENFHLLQQHQQKPYTNIAVKGQNIKSKLNPLAQEFYPSYMRHPKNGYTSNAHQLPNVVAIAAAATHATQYGYLDYDYNNGTTDWPTYDYDFVRYMDYERFMTNHMQRSNTVVPLVKNNYSGGSGSAAPPSASTSFQDQPSYEKLRKQRSFNRSYSSTSYNLRKHHKSSSKEALKENTRSWYIDKKAEEKRMESWKCNGGTADAYQDPVPTTSSSKEEFFEAQLPENSAKRKEMNEEKIDYKDEPPFDQNHTPRAEDRTPQVQVQHKTKSHKSKKQTETSELSRKKLIMLYPSKRTESDLTQSSQDSMFTQPNSLEYTSDESFLAQINSDTPKRIEDDKNHKQSKKNESIIENRNENDVVGGNETTDSLEDFEMTTKPSEPKILDYSNSASPISVIEQVKPRKEKPIKTYLEPRITINRLKKDVERKLNHKNKNTIAEKTSSSKKTTRRSSSLEKGEIIKEVERQNHHKLIIQEVEKETLITKIQEEVERSSHKIIVHPPIKEIKEPKTLVVTSRKFFSASSDGSKDDSKASYRTVRSSSYGVNDNDTIDLNHKQTHKQIIRATAGNSGCGGGGNGGETITTTTTTTHNKTVTYTGAIPKNKIDSTNKHKERTTNEKISSKSNPLSSSPKSQREVVINTPTNRKIQLNNEETPTKIARLATTKVPNSNNNKEEKSKLELWIQRPPNGIVANRVQIFANKPNSIGKTDSHSYEKPELTHKRHAPKPPGMQIGADRKIHKAIVENVLQPPAPTPPPKPATTSTQPISIMRKTNATTTVTATSSVGAAGAGATNTATLIERRSVVPKPIIKTQMRSTTNLTGTSPHKKLNQNITTTTSSSTKKETAETKKIKSNSNSNSRNIQPTSSRSIKLSGTTKMSIREKSSSLKGVKAVIGSDGDNNARVVSSKSCISLRPSMRKLENAKPSVTDTKASKKSSTSNQKNHYSRETIATTLRNLTKEKRRNPYTDPGTDYKIIQSTYVHK